MVETDTGRPYGSAIALWTLGEHNRNLIEGRLVARGVANPYDTLTLRAWLNAVDDVLSSIVGDKTKAVLAALRDVHTVDGARAGVDMFYAACDDDAARNRRRQEQQKQPVHDPPVIPGAYDDDTVNDRLTARHNEDLMDMYAWCVQRNGPDHGHARANVQCARCYDEAVTRVGASTGPAQTA